MGVSHFKWLAPLFHCLFVFSWNERLFSEHSKIKVSKHWSHDHCATMKDPHYAAAVRAFGQALKWDAPDFPKASDRLFLFGSEQAFYYEGSLYWDIAIEPDDFLGENSIVCTRIIEKTVQIDVPTCIYHKDANGNTCLSSTVLPPDRIKEERTFNLCGDYTSLFSVFRLFQQDLAFHYERNIAFLNRRLNDPECSYTTDGYNWNFLRKNDFREYIQDCSKEHENNVRWVERNWNKAVAHSKDSLDYCITHHQEPLAYLNRGILDYWEGHLVDALAWVNKAYRQADPAQLEKLKERALLVKGRAELEAGLYADAVLSLSEAIQQHPHQKEVYLDRAAAYFELGDFDLSIKDYLSSEVQIQPISSGIKATAFFSMGLVRGIVQGGAQAGTEFVPSLLSSLQGIAHGLWAFAQDPVQVSAVFVQAAEECIQFIRENTPQEVLGELVPELKELVEKWPQLKQSQRGELTGCAIGKYGIDILAGAGVARVMQSYRVLKQANNLMTFEAMALSERNNILIKLEAARRAQARKEVLQHANLQIQLDKQGKHIVGHKYYDPSRNRSTLEHPEPQKLVTAFAGKGIRERDLPPGSFGYQEIVNFGEFIGYTINSDTGEKIATTWGKIHYAKDGVHIVPRKPIR